MPVNAATIEDSLTRLSMECTGDDQELEVKVPTWRADVNDAVVLIDYPGFHWHLARVAKKHGIPVFYFVPPQIWAWAGWRVTKMRRFVDHVLCSLPFEETWYRERGVAAEYVGHPFFDELPGQQLDVAFLDAQARRGGTVVGILPGSRTLEVKQNFKTQLRAADAIHRGIENPRETLRIRNRHALNSTFPSLIQHFPG